MKKLLFIISCIIFIQTGVIAEETPENPSQETTHKRPSVQKIIEKIEEEQPPVFYTAAQQERDVHVFSEKNLYGLKDKDGNIVAPAIYKKIVMTGRYGWIVQKKNRYGLMDSKGNYLIEPKYRHADRILGRYIKLGNDNDFGIYNEYGEAILQPEYNSIDLLYGTMFLTNKNFRYGVTDFKGNILIPNICDDIYMVSKDTMKIKYLGTWYELNDISPEKLAMPETLMELEQPSAFKVTDIVTDTGVISGYSFLTFSDYFIKVFSSISPAHEETIDDLILSHGVDTVEILKNFSWVPKYPVTFVKKYYVHVRNPFNGPLSDIRYGLKNKR
ncbi:WG repeat-containing protein [bacterium]|nr:WG repeat-containing protein [bacterium]